MDAASRAELEALRRRAFGPGADIQDDPTALARLIELEELARPSTAGEADEADAVDAAGAADERATGAADERATGAADERATGAGADGGPPTSDAAPRRGWTQRGTLIAGAAATATIVAAVALSQPASTPPPAATPSPTADDHEYVFVADPRAATLMRIRRDGAFGGYIELPTETEPPPFPTLAELDWAAYLGEYYSWDVWIAGGTGDADDEHCILIRRDDDVRAQCADEEGQRRGTLHVSLAGSDIPPEELPAPMTEDDRIRFWWLHSGSIDVTLGPFAVD